MLPRNSLLRRSSKGFSLLEILIVIAIIGMLAGAVIMNADKIFAGAQKDTVKTFIEGLKPVMMKYRMDMGNFPSTELGLNALKSAPADAGKNWQGPYVDNTKDLVDPWKKPYNYVFPGKNNPDGYDVSSSGPDGQPGTGDDIGNWKSAN